jgi:hypothetical protein
MKLATDEELKIAFPPQEDFHSPACSSGVLLRPSKPLVKKGPLSLR